MEEGFKACPYCAEPIRDAATVCRYCNRTLVAAAPTTVRATLQPVAKTDFLSRSWKVFFYVVVICGIGFLALWGILQRDARLSGPRHGALPVPLAPIPTKQNLLSGNLEVGAGQMRWVSFTVPPGATDVQISGAFHAFGGGGNDIMVILTDPFDFENWKNGHATRDWYYSGKVTNGTITVQNLGPGQYVLAFDNRFSFFSRKEVTGEITLTYFTH